MHTYVMKGETSVPSLIDAYLYHERRNLCPITDEKQSDSILTVIVFSEVTVW